MYSSGPLHHRDGDGMTPPLWVSCSVAIVAGLVAATVVGIVCAVLERLER